MSWSQVSRILLPYRKKFHELTDDELHSLGRPSLKWLVVSAKPVKLRGFESELIYFRITCIQRLLHTEEKATIFIVVIGQIKEICPIATHTSKVETVQLSLNFPGVLLIITKSFISDNIKIKDSLLVLVGMSNSYLNFSFRGAGRSEANM